jgi:hypothetical protein
MFEVVETKLKSDKIQIELASSSISGRQILKYYREDNELCQLHPLLKVFNTCMLVNIQYSCRQWKVANNNHNFSCSLSNNKGTQTKILR